MGVTVIVGAQWGDEAKGKISALLAEQSAVVGRYNGGDNAGHTVINEAGSFGLRLMPSGAFNPDINVVIGPGTVINLDTLCEEVEKLAEAGISLEGRFWVSPRCNVVLPYHRAVEAIYEQAKGGGKTGTTKRGMGPVYADKVSYNGIRLFDLANPATFAEKLEIQLRVKNPLLEAFDMAPLDFDAIYDDTLAKFERVVQYAREPFGMLQEKLEAGEEVLAEGAQSALLDNTWGTYPFCTASNTLAGGVAAGLGIAPKWIERAIGVVKTYTARVGNGPFPTELFDSAGEMLRVEGHEYGTVTGRPRRCGWFDAELVRFTTQLNGFDEIALTKLDVLDKFHEIRICVGYRSPEGGESLAHYWAGDAHWLEEVEPVYETVEGWQEPTADVRRFEDLPRQAQAYMRRLEELIGVQASMLSVGPGPEAMIEL